MSTGPSRPRVLLFSQRNIHDRFLFRCPHFEFEDVISKIDNVEILSPRVDISSARSKFSKSLAYHLPILLNPGIEKIHKPDRYDLFFALCGYPTDLLMVNAAIDWTQNCAASVCLIDEVWAKEIPEHRNLYPILKKFDVIALYYSQSVKPLSERIGVKCIFLPPGVDALLFNPYPRPPARLIDVYSIGRRSEATHRALLKMADEEGRFYLHDSIAGNRAIDSAQHRTLFANTAKRSRYFLVNPGLIDKPEKTRGQIELGNRYFEGAASGTIMIGERPHTEAFATHFDWPDAVTHLDYDSTDVCGIIHELDAQTDQQETIRRTNVAQSLLRHDWAYRWESILESVSLQLMPQLGERKTRLRQHAQEVTSGDAERLQTVAQN